MQANMELSSSQILRHPHEYEDENQLTETAGKLSQDFDLKLNLGSTADQSQLIIEENEDYEQEEEEDDDDDDDEKEFSFATFGSDAISSPISADDVFEDGQIRPVFPLFNQDLLLAHEDFKISESRLPHRPPVEKVFIETPPSPSSSSSGKNAEVDGIAAGPYCAWTKTPDQLSKKSNSTGFSKLWRFKEYMHRSNSDGRDAFVFLNSEAKREVKVAQGKDKGNREGPSDKKTAGDVTGEKKKKVKKTVKTKTLSAHEIYLRNKGYFNTEEDRRKSYLPYKPELVGFFTNVNGGGLTKNVHPY